MLTPSLKFEVFFDGQCPLCKREIDFIKKKDRTGQLLLTDISSDEFVEADVPLERLMREIHGKLPNGDYVTGVEVFRQIYQRVGFGGLVSTSRFPIIRHLLDLGYRAFAFLRFKHAVRRMNKAKCSNKSSSVAQQGASCDLLPSAPLGSTSHSRASSGEGRTGS
jgi:predicted DCC family thiol-disulfide oxidoreductase YuxK